MSHQYEGGFINKTPPVVTPASAQGMWTLSQQMQYQQAGLFPPQIFVDDVFSSYIYTGNASTQTINNGIDLAGKGGMVWTKVRNYAYSHGLIDTVRGNTKVLNSNTYTPDTIVSDGITGFNSTGYSLGADTYNGWFNYATTHNYVSWTFRKAKKFFDIVTYTGDGSANRAIAHNLNCEVGMVIVKGTSVNTYWTCFHKSFSAGSEIYLNDTAAKSTNGYFPTLPTSSHFYVNGLSTVGNGTNQTGYTYVAYLFAHDSASDGLIKCGSFTTDAAANATINLGFEPQFVITKSTTRAVDWYISDITREMSNGDSAYLKPNSPSEEINNGSGVWIPTATGLNVKGLGTAGDVHIYVAIRRTNKPPTSGTQVYNAIARTGTGATANVTGVGFNADTVFSMDKTQSALAYCRVTDRLRGVGVTKGAILMTATTAGETPSNQAIINFSPDGMYLSSNSSPNYATSWINWFFKRASGFFDVVCYTSASNSAATYSHNLTVVPEMMIIKGRNLSGNADWIVYHKATGNSGRLNLNTNVGVATGSDVFNFTTPTATTFSVGTNNNVTENGKSFVTYLFATLAGISKVGSYTGNGGTQAIACGFSAGARFVLIKRTDGTYVSGDWYVWDTVRGIVSANDPHLSLNTMIAEVTTDDSIDPYSAGFTVNQVAATNINVTSATYIFLAVA